MMLNITSTALWNGTTVSTTEYDYSDIENSLPCDYGSHASRFLPVLYSLFFIVGLLGNMLVLWVILRGPQLKSMTDVSLLNLAITNLLFIFSLPFLAHYARDTWVFGNEMCVLVLSIYYTGFYAAVFFIVLMSIDRYMAIVHSVFALRIRMKAYGILASMVIWIIAFVSSFPELLYIGVRPHGKEIVCSAYPRDENNSDVRSAAFFKMNALGLLIPLIIVVFCYSKVCQKYQTLQTSDSCTKKQAIRLVFGVLVVFFCCWIPYNIAAFLKALELRHILPPGCENSKNIRLFLQVTEAIAYSHSCLNPFLYVFLGEKCKRNIANLLLQTPCKQVQCINRCLTCAARTPPQQSRDENDQVAVAIA